ncbi:CAP domain-containing protein [Streptomyces sp. NPDC093594]|uniref:CAP domain-containing protein n=1 Tax=Streptomyces sp. NPDC093594 TaxID=3155305 RepID=UPI00344FA169
MRCPDPGGGSPGAENIARGQGSEASVMEAWTNSPGHRANILNRSLTSLGRRGQRRPDLDPGLRPLTVSPPSATDRAPPRRSRRGR